ncbi:MULTISPECIES: response regulator transcription factor [Aerococcus]|uniref:Response regulator transcription factor n=1 Tax=Aerococcus sanguinicola TaxID=119206 RepID=A0A5N1GN67_9LACT|nr:MULTISPECIES: response regulator transcription factor [Aerococcus]KAA9301688.1 response regulator transcription factor [Aerococcus sanguinicola]MDK6368899.1 response regulator transcription factor [Aerococcus sp. UMB9870]MDK6680237.1 response regulator transcription factor [Aerococcus sp. UMB8608]MDK6687288.1 response regulator transcription factor [Aerococcus sp. UMB8623]MDK6940385.1 response regulator transcription factor [Aerococcus sp. UMB8487]
MIKVLIVDDHEMVRLGVASYLAIQEDIEVIAEAVNGQEAYDKAMSLHPDLILMDVVMDEMDGIEATQAILADWPEARILMVTSFLDDDKLYPAIEAGAKGYILKTSSAQEIAQAIRQVMAGQEVMTQAVAEKMQEDKHKAKERQLHDDLTKRELEVLALIAEGKSNQEIADLLFITLKTVKTHVSNILSKLEVSDRTQATIYAFKHGLVREEKE